MVFTHYTLQRFWKVWTFNYRLFCSLSTVGSEQGSSIAELQSAAAAAGLHALAFRRLSVDDLRLIDRPVVLHTRSDLGSTNYNHFVLFAGFHEGKAKVFDGMKGVREWTLAEVSSRWDGNALILSREPINLAPVRWRSGLRVAAWLISIACVAALSAYVEKRLNSRQQARWRVCRNQIVLLCAATAFGAFVFHAFATTGFVTGSEAVRAVRAANASTFLPRIDFAEASELLKGGDAAFVDARKTEDYRREHISSAINLPATAPEAQAMQIAKTLPRHRRLVVYCSNPYCPYAFTIAQRLLDAGHTNVVVYPGGLDEGKRTARVLPRDNMDKAASKTAWVVQRAIGLLLIYSALIKIQRPYELLTSVFQYQVLGPTSGTLFSALLPFLELTLGVGLLCGVCTLGAAALTGVLFLVFTVGQASALLRGIDTDCGCFGAGEKVGWLSLLRTFALMCGAAMIFFQAARRAPAPV